jgi:hypothetical protein
MHRHSDATHCWNYKKGKCPRNCYRAQLTEELNQIHDDRPVSWAMFEGTEDCPKIGGRKDND